jgi:ATP-binding cassette subfamily B protein
VSADLPCTDGSAAAEAPADRVLRRGVALLVRSIGQEPRVFTVAVAGSAVFALCTVLQATVIGHIVDHTVLPAVRTGHTTRAALVGAGAAVLGVAALKALGITCRRWFAGVMQYRLQARYRRLVTGQLLRLPLAWHTSRPTGELLSVANSDVEAMFWPIAPFPFACGIAVMLVATVVQVLSVDLILSVVGLATIPGVFAVNALYNRVQAPLATRAQQLRGDLAAVAHESFDGALVVKTLGGEEGEAARFGQRSQALRDVNIRLGRIRGLFEPVMEVIPTLGVLGVLLVGSYRVQSGAVTTGQLVTVAYLFVQIAFPVRAIGWVLAELPRAVVGRDRVQSVLDAQDDLAPGTLTLSVTGAGRVRMCEVQVRYGEQVVLAGVDLDIKAGTTVALVGATGAGKSTITALLVRLQDPDVGTVLLDEVDLRSLRLGEIARHVAYVPQVAFLFDDTVRGNVILGLDPGAVGDDAVWAALRLAQADSFVAALPRGLDSRLGERGTSLSGGQKQRLALARALVRGPRVLVLDDATSAVDPQVEAAILAGLRTSAGATTVVVVAYRRATIALADEVLWLDEGRIAARGGHAELLRSSPGYAGLVTAYDDAAHRRATGADSAVSVAGSFPLGVTP